MAASQGKSLPKPQEMATKRRRANSPSSSPVLPRSISSELSDFFDERYWKNSPKLTQPPQISQNRTPQGLPTKTVEMKDVDVPPVIPVKVLGPANSSQRQRVVPGVNAWPVSFRAIESEEFVNWPHLQPFLIKLPDKRLTIRESQNAKKPTCLCLEIPTQCGFAQGPIDTRFIPLKITSRVRDSQTRGSPVACIEYRYRDGKWIAIGGAGSRLQIQRSAMGAIPQAFLVSKTETFAMRTGIMPSAVWYSVFDPRMLRLGSPTVKLEIVASKRSNGDQKHPEKRIVLLFDIGIPITTVNQQSRDILPVFAALPSLKEKFERTHPGCQLHDRMPMEAPVMQRTDIGQPGLFRWVVEFRFLINDHSKLDVVRQIAFDAISSILPQGTFRLRGIFPGDRCLTLKKGEENKTRERMKKGTSEEPTENTGEKKTREEKQ